MVDPLESVTGGRELPFRAAEIQTRGLWKSLSTELRLQPLGSGHPALARLVGRAIFLLPGLLCMGVGASHMVEPPGRDSTVSCRHGCHPRRWRLVWIFF